MAFKIFSIGFSSIVYLVTALIDIGGVSKDLTNESTTNGLYDVKYVEEYEERKSETILAYQSGDEVKAGEPAKVESEDGQILHLSQDIVEAGDESADDNGNSDEEDGLPPKNEKQTKKSPTESGTKTSASEKMANLVTPKSGGKPNVSADES